MRKLRGQPGWVREWGIVTEQGIHRRAARRAWRTRGRTEEKPISGRRVLPAHSFARSSTTLLYFRTVAASSPFLSAPSSPSLALLFTSLRLPTPESASERAHTQRQTDRPHTITQAARVQASRASAGSALAFTELEFSSLLCSRWRPIGVCSTEYSPQPIDNSRARYETGGIQWRRWR